MENYILLSYIKAKNSSSKKFLGQPKGLKSDTWPEPTSTTVDSPTLLTTELTTEERTSTCYQEIHENTFTK